MPIRHRVEENGELLVVERLGTVTPEEEADSLRARGADPEVRPGIPVMVDCTRLDVTDSPTHVRQVAERALANARHLRCGRVAIVVRDDAAYGMARMYQALTEDSHPITQVFRALQPARRWLLEDGSPGGIEPADGV
jgi:hypothetical protein